MIGENLHIFFTTIFFGCILSIFLKWRNQKRLPVPPGPSWYSILLWMYNSYKISLSPATALKNLADIYGDVMTFNIGPVKAVIFSSHESIHDILRSDFAVDRVQLPLIMERNMNQNLGLVWSNGDNWEETRRFTLRQLRQFGYNKSLSMDTDINDECSKFLRHFRHLIQQNPEQIVNMDGAFKLPFLNKLWKFVTGKSYDYNDPEMEYLLNIQKEFFRTSNSIFDPVFPPWFRNLFPNWTGKAKQMESILNVNKLSEKTLLEHKKYVKFNSEPRGFLDAFIKAQENYPNKTAFTDENCIISLLDLIIAGTDISSNTLSFGILYMLLNPQIQAKVYAEIDSNIKPNEPILMEMRDILPYTHATFLEIFRNGIVLRLPTPRQATHDFIFKNYLIEKGTFLITNVKASHFNVNTWGDPENFRPERFLNEDGTQVDGEVVELLDSFGGGKRVCIGQSGAEASLFIFFVSLLREFKFVQVEGLETPSLEHVPGAVCTPRPYHVKVVERL